MQVLANVLKFVNPKIKPNSKWFDLNSQIMSYIFLDIFFLSRPTYSVEITNHFFCNNIKSTEYTASI